MRRSIVGRTAATADVGLDQKPRAATEPGAIHLDIFEYALHVVAGLGKRNALDPVDWIDIGITWVAVAFDPFVDAATPGIIASEGQDVGAAIGRDIVAELGGAQLRVVDDIVDQALLVVGNIEFLGHV